MSSITNLPDPLDESKGSLKISGNNHSDDLFMFIKRKISGLAPNISYQVTYNMEFVSNVADNMAGAGGSPGESVFIKAGATQVEPKKMLDTSGRKISAYPFSQTKLRKWEIRKSNFPA